MASLANGNRRRLVCPEDEVDYLREELVWLYRDDRRYEHLIAHELGPIWEREGCQDRVHAYARQREEQDVSGAGLSPEQLDRLWAVWRPRVRWEDVEALASAESNLRLHDYLGGVREAVARMGLYWQGEPALWALGYVHADAADMPEPGSLQPFSELPPRREPEVELDLRIKLDVTGAYIWGRVDGEHVPLSCKGDERLIHEPPAVFDNRAALEDIAGTVLRDLIALGWARYERHFPQRNQASLLQRKDDLQLLYRHLFYGDPIPDKLDRDRLRKLAQQIGVNFPRGAPE